MIERSNVRINLGQPNQNYITASVAVALGNFSFVFVAYIDGNGGSFITGVSILYAVFDNHFFNFLNSV